MKEKRIKLGITTYDLQKSGIGTKTYKAIESGGNYTKKSLEKYLKVLNLKNESYSNRRS